MPADKPADPKGEYTMVAYYYYKAKLTQEDIAQKLNMSRQRVNRILGKCESLGIVRITVVGSDKLFFDMETEIEKKYDLTAVRIVGSDISENIYSDLGTTAGEYLAGILENGDVIGFSRGRATAALVDHMPEVNKNRLTVTQLVGGWNGKQSNIDVDDIVSRFAQKLNAAACKLFAPVVVNSPEIRRSIMEEPYFINAYKTIKSCSIAVVGIGNMENRTLLADSSSGVEKGDFRGYMEKNAVGEVCTHFFDIEGNRVETDFNERIISITLDDFLKIPKRIGIAGLRDKIKPIKGAIRGGYINVLITDSNTATALLK